MRCSPTCRASGRSTVAGDVVDQMSDSEMMDSLDYTVFPNMHPWGAFNRITYRFRPNGDDHRSAIMECFFLSPFQGERPPPAKERKLGPDDPWTDAPELGMLAKVFEQDVFNMAKVQKGLNDAQAGRHVLQLSGVEDPLAARAAGRVRRRHDHRRSGQRGDQAVNGIVHPFSGALHEQDGEGNIRVTLGDKTGIFGTDGHWISGELRQCDPQLCGWVGGPLIANHRSPRNQRTAEREAPNICGSSAAHSSFVMFLSLMWRPWPRPTPPLPP